MTLQIVFLSSWSLRYTACPGKHWIRQHVAINLISFHLVSVNFPLFLFSSVWPPGSRQVHVTCVTQVTFGFCSKIFQRQLLGTAQRHPLLAHPRQGQLPFRSSCRGDGTWPRGQGGWRIAAWCALFVPFEIFYFYVFVNFRLFYSPFAFSSLLAV